MRNITYGMLAAIAVLALMEAMTRVAASFDESVRKAVHFAASPALTAFFKSETWLGSWIVLLPVCIVAALWQKRIILMLAAYAGAAALTEAAKVIVQRPRPLPYFNVSPETWSFPSGHSLESAAVYWTLAAVIAASASLPGRRVVVYSLAVLPVITGLSRIYLGMHYPTDVIAGWAAGGCWSAGMVRALAAGSVRRVGCKNAPDLDIAFVKRVDDAER
jgi:undecaprenyl-diphosphatase